MINIEQLNSPILQKRIDCALTLYKNAEKIDIKHYQALRQSIETETHNMALYAKLYALSQFDFLPKKKIEFKEHTIKLTYDKNDRFIISFELKGLQYRDLGALEGNIEISQCLYFIQEPDNAYDEHAVLAVNAFGYVIGYVPKEYSVLIANGLSKNKSIYARIKFFRLSDAILQVDVFEK